MRQGESLGKKRRNKNEEKKKLIISQTVLFISSKRVAIKY